MSGPALPPIGERLRQARLDRGLTVRGLARLVDVSASLISQIETGKSSPSVSTLYVITAALSISIEDVFGEPDAARAHGAAATADTARRATVAANGRGESSEVAPAPVVGSVAAIPTFTAPANAAAALAGDTILGGASVTAQGLRMLAHKRRVGPVVPADQREVLFLDSGVSWELLGQLPDNHVDFLRITYQPGGSSSGAGVLMRHSGTEWGHMLSGQLTLTLGFDTYVLDPGDSISFDCSTPHSYANHGTEPAVGVWFVAERFR